MKTSPKVLITGANSFIGSYFKEHAPGYVVDEICLQNNAVEDIDFSGYDTVFHVAAIVHQTSKLSDSLYFHVNSNLAYDVASRAKSQGVTQFVFMSTAKVYGENCDESAPWSEDTECVPLDAYGKSKLDAENKLRRIASEDFIVSVVRTPVVYGAGVKGNILKMASYINATHFIPLDGIENKRAMVYIGNLIAMIYRIIDLRKGGVFLASDKRAVSTSEFASFMIESSGKNKKFISIPSLVQSSIKVLSPKNYMRLFGSMVIDNRKTLEELSFTPPYTIKEGVDEVMEHINATSSSRSRLFVL